LSTPYGRKSAVADFGRVKVTGAPAWWLWGAVHVFFLVGVRNRLSVMLGWMWSCFTFDVGVRLITETGADISTRRYPRG
jgi:NADH dehydrogenase FAD-containing subunit